MTNPKDTITIQKESLFRISYTIPLFMVFIYLTKLMLFAPHILWLPGVTVNEQLEIAFRDENKNVYFEGKSTFNMAEGDSPSFCRFQQNTDEMGCLEEENNQRIKIIIDESGQEGVTCHQVRREGLRCVNQMVKDCYSLGSVHWYGGFESFAQHWPLKQSMPQADGLVLGEDGAQPKSGVELNLMPYVSGDYGVHKVELLNVLGRLFISSSGVGVVVSEESPLYIGFNQHGDEQLCIGAMYDNSHYTSPLGKPPVLDYTVCKADDVKTIYKYMKKRFIQKPESIPNKDLFVKPIWSTWAQYKKDINQSAVLDFANKIKELKFPISQLEIDDKWTPEYGDLDFDKKKFPNPKQMVQKLTELGFPITLWIQPFIGLTSKAFREAVENQYTVMGKFSEIPSLVKWWNEDMAVLLDVTNPAAVQWYLRKLTFLKETYNITSFKFDAGEARFVPYSHSTHQPLKSTNDYSTLWAELAYNADSESRRQEVRTAWRTQRLPVFLRMMDRMSTWSLEGGLQSLIPATLTLGLIGYPFVLPDMVGGNAYVTMETIEAGAYPEKELFIRWLEVNTFLPSIQFSVAPWSYDEEVVKITLKFLKLREKYSSLLIELAEESVRTGDPIIRPLWWIDQHSQEALTALDEFLVGNRLLVAPVIEDGARKRNIFLPEGLWDDRLRGGSYTGPITLNDYAVALDELPFFEKS